MIIAITNHKGGVGKTTTAVNLGVALAAQGAAVLLIDLDPLGALTKSLGYAYDEANPPPSVYDVVVDSQADLAARVQTTDYGVDVLRSSPMLAGIETALARRIGREHLLQRALATPADTPLAQRYAFILIDTPSNLNLCTVLALTAADTVLVPFQPESLAFAMLPELANTIHLVQDINPTLQLGGIVLTMYDARTSLHQAIEAEVREEYGQLVFATMIPNTIRVAEAPAHGIPLQMYAPTSSATAAYHDLATEVRTRYAETI
ncbi:MAG: ParA family protein [Blastochloris sp.]|nr:ParA family protein [Blastochloris sp.]